MIITQNNHILELLEIDITILIKELTTIDYNADGGGFDCKAARWARYHLYVFF
jgi:hypothetical protein